MTKQLLVRFYKTKYTLCEHHNEQLIYKIIHDYKLILPEGEDPQLNEFYLKWPYDGY